MCLCVKCEEGIVSPNFASINTIFISLSDERRGEFDELSLVNIYNYTKNLAYTPSNVVNYRGSKHLCGVREHQDLHSGHVRICNHPKIIVFTCYTRTSENVSIVDKVVGLCYTMHWWLAYQLPPGHGKGN